MEFYYENNRGERIDLSDYPYIFQEGSLLDWTYTYSTDNLVNRDVTYDYKMAAKSTPIKLAVLCDYTIPLERRKQKWKEAVDHLCDVISTDVADNKNGKLYTDTGFYLNCKIVGSQKSDCAWECRSCSTLLASYRTSQCGSGKKQKSFSRNRVIWR
ncbi:hypothetical protein [Mediterraneibacter massiliensis]|uniref:hypothetical protein n=1 Tax=Mediterraneibacter massiliensis TaxID=1720300 RepID=UPI0022E42D01|nr:hypothetical protein [Mediterraneibacter massiliensis]